MGTTWLWLVSFYGRFGSAYNGHVYETKVAADTLIDAQEMAVEWAEETHPRKALDLGSIVRLEEIWVPCDC